MAHRVAPISVSIALGHASANAVRATAVGWSTGSSSSLTFPLHSHMSSTRREGSEYHFKSLWYDSAGARTHDLQVVRQTLYHWPITPVRGVGTEDKCFPVQKSSYLTLSLYYNALAQIHLIRKFLSSNQFLIVASLSANNEHSPKFHDFLR